MPKRGERFWYAVFILCAIFFSQAHIPFAFGVIGVSYLIIILFFFILLARQTYSIYSVLAVYIIAFCYAGIQLFYVYDPIWFLGNLAVICGVITCILAFLLGKTNENVVTIFILGQSLGEALFWVVIHQVLHIHVQVGTLAYLDTLSISSIFLGFWFALKAMTRWLELLIDKTVKEKGRTYE